MNGNGQSTLDGQPHIDVVISLYPTLNGYIAIKAPAELAPFQVLGMLEIAKSEYYMGVKKMQSESRIIPAMAVPGKIAS
jgi:hypothetical protein